MAILHITKAEAASNFAELIEKVCTGEEVYIDEDVRTIAVLRTPKYYEGPRLLSEIIAGLSGSDSSMSIDSHFAEDVQEGIRSHEHERLIDPWESF